MIVSAQDLSLLGVWDTPGRDPRGWSVSVVWVCVDDAEARAVGADDAADARWWPTSSPLPELAFDHREIVAAGLSRCVDAQRRGLAELDDPASGDLCAEPPSTAVGQAETPPPSSPASESLVGGSSHRRGDPRCSSRAFTTSPRSPAMRPAT